MHSLVCRFGERKMKEVTVSQPVGREPMRAELGWIRAMLAVIAFLSLQFSAFAIAAEPDPLRAQLDAVVDPNLLRYSESQRIMGVEFEVILYARSEVEARRGIDSAFDRITQLDKIFSDYDPQSEINQIADGTRLSAKASQDFQFLWAKSQEIRSVTNNAFDPTMGELTKLWRRARRQGELPDAAAIDHAKKHSGMQAMKQPGGGKLAVRFDFGGIAKGYAAGEALKAIKEFDLSQALVRGAGDIAAGDPPPGKEGWVVGVAPLNPDDKIIESITVANECVSTSGDARQHLVVDGKRYSHILDPRTGDPIEGRSSVTVVAPQGWQADGLATAFSVRGPEVALKIAKEQRVRLLMIVEREGKQVRFASDDWK